MFLHYKSLYTTLKDVLKNIAVVRFVSYLFYRRKANQQCFTVNYIIYHCYFNFAKVIITINLYCNCPIYS